jgi:hypothetical protein
MIPGHTVGGTLGHWALAASTTDTNTVDDIALLGLVTQTAGLVGTRWAGCSVNDIQLSKLYFALSAKFNECIARSIGEMSTSPNILIVSVRGSKFEVLGFDRCRFKGRSILPPSIEHGEGSAAHQTASSSRSLPSTCSHP